MSQMDGLQWLSLLLLAEPDLFSWKINEANDKDVQNGESGEKDSRDREQKCLLFWTKLQTRVGSD